MPKKRFNNLTHFGSMYSSTERDGVISVLFKRKITLQTIQNHKL